jgi:hypothetical protein
MNTYLQYSINVFLINKNEKRKSMTLKFWIGNIFDRKSFLKYEPKHILINRYNVIATTYLVVRTG